MIKQISVQELKTKIDQGGVLLVDCREEEENKYCRIEGSLSIPLSQFAERALKELKPDQEICIHCHHGGRSQRAGEFLSEQGFTNVSNLTGGIDAWSLTIDSKVPRY